MCAITALKDILPNFALQTCLCRHFNIKQTKAHEKQHNRAITKYSSQNISLTYISSTLTAHSQWLNQTLSNAREETEYNVERAKSLKHRNIMSKSRKLLNAALKSRWQLNIMLESRRWLNTMLQTGGLLKVIDRGRKLNMLLENGKPLNKICWSEKGDWV